jgi:hypothetical protein
MTWGILVYTGQFVQYQLQLVQGMHVMVLLSCKDYIAPASCRYHDMGLAQLVNTWSRKDKGHEGARERTSNRTKLNWTSSYLLASCSSLDPHLLKVRLLPQTTIISSLH